MSDTTDLSIIGLLMIGLILYMLYVKMKISTKHDINSIKCNPVNLFLKSINSDQEKSVKEFAECVKIFTPPCKDTKDATGTSTS